MKKQELKDKVIAVKGETQTALQTVFDALNQGQQKKILRNENIKALFEMEINLDNNIFAA